MEPAGSQQEGPDGAYRAVLRRCCLPGGTPATHHVGQALDLVVAGKLGGNGLVDVGLVGQVMERQSVGGEARVALVQGVRQQPLHGLQLGLGGVPGNAFLKTHGLDPQHGVRHQCDQVRAQGEAVEVLDVLFRVLPVDPVRGGTEYRFGDVLHPGITIHDGIGAGLALGAKGQPQAAVGDHHRGGAVAHRFRQPRRHLQFQVVMGVDIEQARHGPLAPAVDHLPGLVSLQAGTSGHDPPPGDGDVLDARILLAGAVEYLGPLNQVIPLEITHTVLTGTLPVLSLLVGCAAGPGLLYRAGPVPELTQCSQFSPGCRPRRSNSSPQRETR